MAGGSTIRAQCVTPARELERREFLFAGITRGGDAFPMKGYRGPGHWVCFSDVRKAEGTDIGGRQWDLQTYGRAATTLKPAPRGPLYGAIPAWVYIAMSIGLGVSQHKIGIGVRIRIGAGSLFTQEKS